MPPPLQSDSVVALTAPSGWAPLDEAQAGIQLLQAAGYEVRTDATCASQFGRFSAPDALRLEALQALLDAPDVAAIWCLRGGYGLQRIVDELDWSGFKRHPKWLIGFSDITALHQAAWVNGWCSIHGPVAVGPHRQPYPLAYELLIKLLAGEKPEISLPLAKDQCLRAGQCVGPLLGGNLTIYHQNTGTQHDYATEGCILLLEEVAEPLYHFDRMMWHLKRAGKLSPLAGFIMGHLTNINDTEPTMNAGVKDLIFNILPDNIPIIWGFPSGHEAANLPWVHGAKYLCTATPDMLNLALG